MSEPEHVTTTRLVYDQSTEVFIDLIGTTVSPQFETDEDLETLEKFAELVTAAGGGPVLDVGCGPGRISAFLYERQIDVSGTDLSGEMVAAARSAHPSLRFGRGALEHLPVGDATLAGAVYWYSIIHSPLDALAEVWTEASRALAFDAYVLVAFQAGNNELHLRDDAYGTGQTLTSYRHSVDDVADSLSAAGFEIMSRLVREPQLEHEVNQQAILTARLRPIRQLDLDLR